MEFQLENLRQALEDDGLRIIQMTTKSQYMGFKWGIGGTGG